ncbi:MAG: hypothetical protein V4707_06825 [Pseudomonadota bacterium]
MSADEFDPFVERLFNQPPVMPDAQLFAATVETRLASGNRVRTLALTLAGLVGGVVAVRETMNINLDVGGEGLVAGRAIGQGVNAMSQATQGAVQSGLDQLGVSGMEFGSMGAMQLFWVAAGALIAVAAAGVVKLSQEG